MSGNPVTMLAKKFLLSKASDGFLSFIAWVSVVGVALGVLSLTVVTSVINGFEGELIKTITGMNGDVVLYSRGDPVGDAPAVEEKIRRVLPAAEAITPSFMAELMVSGPDGVAGAVIDGIDSATFGSVTSVASHVVQGRMPEKEGEIALGASLASRIGVFEGNQVRIIVPFVQDKSGATGADTGGMSAPKVFKARVSGIIKMGMHDYDSKFMFAPMLDVQKYLDYPGRVTSFRIKLRDGSDSRRASDALSANFGYPFRAKDWGQQHKNLFYAIQLEKAVIAVILTVIVIVAAFNVVSTLMMMIHDKTKELAILKAMGLRPAQGFALFCYTGMGIGAVGVAAGVAVGMVLNKILERTKIINLPADIYYIDYLPVIVRWNEIALVGLVALLITFAATIYPSWRAVKRSPLDGLRYE